MSAALVTALRAMVTEAQSQGMRSCPALELANAALKEADGDNELLWLVQRAQGLRNVKRWSKAERERSWADWDKRAMAAVAASRKEAA